MRSEVDVLVVGAGIHGAGVAQAVAAAGHSVELVEARDIAAGTSSRSSKLIHGGLRYLETAQIGLVRESLVERRLMLQLAPGLVRLLPMHIPVYRSMRRAPWQIRAGLSAYAILSSLERNSRFRSLPQSAWSGLEGLETEGLLAVYRYNEAQTDDAALTRAVVASAQSLGAQISMPATFRSGERHQGSVVARLQQDGRERELRARVLVNAAGPWAAGVARTITPEISIPTLDLVQGTHVEYEGVLATGAFYVEAPADGRAVFVLPWGTRTMVGTTERLYRGDPAEVRPLQEERDYLHQTFAKHFPHRAGEAQVAAWAGLRVLPAAGISANRRSRETMLEVDHPTAPAVVSIYGGKLTTWRATAASVMALLTRSLPTAVARGDTRKLALG